MEIEAFENDGSNADSIEVEEDVELGGGNDFPISLAVEDQKSHVITSPNSRKKYDQEVEEFDYDEVDVEIDDDGDGDDEEEEEDDEKEEDKLKFDRVENDLIGILDKDSVSCIAVHSKFLVIGSHRGLIYILDHLGNNVTLNSTKCIEAHKVSVNQISIDESGDHIASCSTGGIHIYNICENEVALSLELQKNIRCITIDPLYSRGGLSRRFIIGDDESVTLYERNIFSRLKSTTLLNGGPVTNVSWGERFVVWSFQAEVRVYDMVDRVTINRILFNWHDIIEKQTNVMKYHVCHFMWKKPFTLFIGWADEVVICNVKMKINSSSFDLPTYYVEICCIIPTEFWICGISSFDSYLVLLAHEKVDNIGLVCGRKPKLMLLEAGSTKYKIIADFVLSTRGYEYYVLSNYHIDSLGEELLYFIATPKDIILAKPRDQDDHIEWLMDHEKYEEALESASQNAKSLNRHSLLQVGLAYFDHLIEVQKFNEAGKLCVKILAKDNPTQWEEQVLKFAQLGQLRAIAPFLPRTETTKLNPYIYELVLFDYLKKDPESFLSLVREWEPPPQLYNIQAIINAIIDHLLVQENRHLLMALADLYSYEKRYGKALGMYLKLQDKQVFQLIQRYGLYEEIKDKIEDLMVLDVNCALSLLMKYKERVPPTLVVHKLETSRYHLYRYLDMLYKVEGKEMNSDFHGPMVSLYADFGHRDDLLNFLRSSDHYPMQEAFAICKSRTLYPEMVFLLSRMGNSKEALKLILLEVDDINQAIEFCKEHDDKDLWNDLINYSLDKPNYINILLCNIGAHVDPRILIQKIEPRMEIPGLRDSLVKIMQDYNLQVALQEGCKNILVGDCLILFEKLVKTQLRGVFVEDNQECGSCHKLILYKEFNGFNDIKIFFCKHVFHNSCLSSFDFQNCVICNKPRKGSCFLERL